MFELIDIGSNVVRHSSLVVRATKNQTTLHRI
jgi:hypothetical protein